MVKKLLVSLGFIYDISQQYQLHIGPYLVIFYDYPHTVGWVIYVNATGFRVDKGFKAVIDLLYTNDKDAIANELLFNMHLFDKLNF